MSPAIIEALKLAMGLYFSIAKMNNATEQELNKIYQSEKSKFLKNLPSKLEQV
ncbi:MAG: hypothetical protein P9L97_06090 [Candidatus Tenebribacter davisii]|nr:hypothetical protein [Candidatus Tenebribacter davisii]